MTRPILDPLGDRAWIARFERDDQAAAWAAVVRDRSWPGVIDAVSAYRSAAVFADPELVDLDELEETLRAVPVPEGGPHVGRLVTIPVLYDGEDLGEVARCVGLEESGVAARHAGVDYTVRAIGFLPGFPYLGELPERLSGLPRRATPRTRVPAGSVAIAGRQSCIYPRASPGGWHLLGRTPMVIADPAIGHFPLRSGDRVRFEPIDLGRFEALRGRRLDSDPPGDGGADPGTIEPGRDPAPPS